MATVITGARTTLNTAQGNRVPDVSDKMWLLDPDMSPLAVLLGSYGKEFVRSGNNIIGVSGVSTKMKAAHNPEYTWFEDAIESRADILTATYTNVATSVVVADGTKFFVGAVILNTITGEVMIVDVVTTNTLTVRRGVGNGGTGIASTNTAPYDEIFVIGNVYGEGALSRTARSLVPVKANNYTQIFREPIDLTRTEQNQDLFTGSDEAYIIRKKGLEFCRDIERAFWFGKKQEVTVNGKPERTTDGILNVLVAGGASTTNASGALTAATLETFARNLFNSGSSKKLVFCSPLVLSAISGLSAAKLLTTRTDSMYGVSITEYQSPHGVMMFIRQPLFRGAVYGGYAVGVDWDNVNMRFLNNSNIQLKKNIQAPDYDGVRHEFLAEVGMECKLPTTHAVLYGVTG